MSKEKWQSLSRTQLQELAQKTGIIGPSRMAKDKLVAALVRLSKTQAKVKQKKSSKSKVASRRRAVARPQRHAAHHSNGSISLEEQVERSKYDVGVPTKDLSAKAPRELPKGYGKDRIVCMVRDPYWLHTYWELTRTSVQRAEAALAQHSHRAPPIAPLLRTNPDATATS